MQLTEKSRLEVCFLYRKLHGSLEVSISFASIFGVIIFLLNGIFGGEENVLGDYYTKAVWAAQNKVRKRYLTGFWYLTGLLAETKKLLTTDISNSVFLSSSRWEAVIFSLERSRPMSGRIKINNAQCITVSANGSLRNWWVYAGNIPKSDLRVHIASRNYSDIHVNISHISGTPRD